jgi:hypothetical protein
MIRSRRCYDMVCHRSGDAGSLKLSGVQRVLPAPAALHSASHQQQPHHPANAAALSGTKDAHLTACQTGRCRVGAGRPPAAASRCPQASCRPAAAAPGLPCTMRARPPTAATSAPAAAAACCACCRCCCAARCHLVAGRRENSAPDIPLAHHGLEEAAPFQSPLLGTAYADRMQWVTLLSDTLPVVT